MIDLALPFPDIDPVAIRLGPLAIHWYALMYILAFIMGYFLMKKRLRHEPYNTAKPEWTNETVEEVLTATILGVLIGGRIGYALFYKAAYYVEHPIEIFKLWEGGMSFHGGALGVILALALVAWKQKRPFLLVTDLLVPSVPLGLAAGRIGNFINGELWGREAPESLPWAMIFPTGGDVPRHPSQLYQALLEGVLLFVILWLFARKFRYRGQASGFFLAGYGVFRFIGEMFRQPDAHLGFLGFGMTMGQWLSVPMVIAGVALIWWGAVKKTDDREPVAASSESDES